MHFFSDCKTLSLPSIQEEFGIDTQEKRTAVLDILSEILKRAPQEKVDLITQDLIKHIPDDRWLEINDTFSSDEPMNWHELNRLTHYGAVIGSHCHDHCILHNCQNKVLVKRQLIKSKNLIEKHIGACWYFAYPNGQHGDFTTDAAQCIQESGYRLAFTTMRGEIRYHTNFYALPRLWPYTELDLFKFTLNFPYHIGFSKA